MKYYYYEETFTGKGSFKRHCRSETPITKPFKQSDGGVFTYKEIEADQYRNGAFQYA